MGPSLKAPGKILSFQGAKGGVGTTTLACLFGRALAANRPDLAVALVDPCPSSLSPLPSWMSLDGKERDLAQLASLPGRRTRALLEGYFPRSPEGLMHVSAGSGTSPEDPFPILNDLASCFDWLLVDLSPLGLLQQAAWRERSHGILIVTDWNEASLTTLARWEKRLLAEHIDLGSCRVWLNDPQGSGSADAPLPRGLSLAATTPHLGNGLSLALLERKELPPQAVAAIQPVLEPVLSATATGRTPPPLAAPDHREEKGNPDDHLAKVRSLHQRLLEHLRAEGILTGEAPLGASAREMLEPRAREALERFVQELDVPEPSRRKTLVADTLKLSFGLGPLEPLLADASVTEVMVNGPHEVFIEREGRLHRSDARFLDDQQLRTIIERILAPLGRRIDESQPTVDARLPDGSRVNAVIPPLSLDGPILTIRKFPARRLTIADLIAHGSLSQEAADFLGASVRIRRNIVVSGGTGSGKTTLLNVLSGFIPGDERIVTIEDSAELRLAQEHVVRLEARPPNLEGRGRVSIRDLVINALRMRPDRIVVGEVRGGEALDMLQAMNTGHDGSLTTVHANSPRDALSRLETLCLMAGLELPLRAVREQVARAVHLVVQTGRLPGGKRSVTHIAEIQGMDGDVILLQDLFAWEKGRGLVRRPFAPSFLKDLEAQGYRLPAPLNTLS